MKLTINWDEAPEWANYAAMDGNGTIWFHEQKPLIYKEEFNSEGRIKPAKLNTKKWETSITPRPGVDDD